MVIPQIVICEFLKQGVICVLHFTELLQVPLLPTPGFKTKFFTLLNLAGILKYQRFSFKFYSLLLLRTPQNQIHISSFRLTLLKSCLCLIIKIMYRVLDQNEAK